MKTVKIAERKLSSMLTIIPVNESRGFGNGWEPCQESEATGFEVDDGNGVIAFFDTRAEAEIFIDGAVNVD